MAPWMNGNSMTDRAKVADVLQTAGLAVAELMALAADPQVKDWLRLQTGRRWSVASSAARRVDGRHPVPAPGPAGLCARGPERLNFSHAARIVFFTTLQKRP